MGLFSTKKKHIVDTQIVRLIEDDMIPDTNTKALLSAMFGDDTGIVDALQDEALNGSHTKFSQMYQYAEDGEYYYGLPNATLRSNVDGVPLATTALETEIGLPITVDYLFYRPLNNIHEGWKTLTEDYAYNRVTNEIEALTTTKPNRVYLNKMVSVHATAVGQEVEKSSLGTFETPAAGGPTPERPAWDDVTKQRSLVSTQEIRVGLDETESVEVHYVWKDVNDVITHDMFIVDLTAFDTDAEYYQARYEHENGSIGYWTYDPSTAVHLELTQLHAQNSYIDPGTYFPFAVLRSEGVDRTTEDLREFDQYSSTKKLLEFIGLDLDALGDTLSEGAAANDIKQSVLMMAVPITTDNPTEIDYLFRYFKDLQSRLPVAGQREANYQEAPNIQSDFGLSAGTQTSYAIEITDADFEMSISFDAITRHLFSGSIGPIGTVSNSTSTGTDFSSVILENVGNFVGVAATNTRVFKKQLTAGIYEQILVRVPKIRYRIYRDRAVEGGASDDRLLIPIDRSIAVTMPLVKQTELYQRSLHFVFNSHVVQETKWYQTGAFQVLLTIVSIVITIITAGAASPLVIAAEAGAAALTIAVINIIVTQIVKSLVFKVVFTKVVEAIGVEGALWVAVAAALVGAGKAISTGALVAKSTAANLLAVSNGLVTGGSEVMKQLGRDLIDEMAEFDLFAEQQMGLLDDAHELLDTSLELNPFEFIGSQPRILFGESPDNYYARTVHSGNIGVQGINIVQNYVEISLRLPTINETLGDSTG